MLSTRFRGGLMVGSALGGAVVAVLLICLIPTNEFRARLWFLVAVRSGGYDLPLETAFGVVILFLGVAVLVLLRSVNRDALLGLAVAAGLHAIVLAEGGWKWLPEFRTVWTQVLAAVISLGLTSWTLRVAFLVLRRPTSRVRAI
jgi:hypothetical protein